MQQLCNSYTYDGLINIILKLRLKKNSNVFNDHCFVMNASRLKMYYKNSFLLFILNYFW